MKAYRSDIRATVLRLAPQLRGNTLVVQGAIDPLIEARARADELMQAAPLSGCEVVMLEGADHYFNARHEQLADCILQWIRRTGGGVR